MRTRLLLPLAIAATAGCRTGQEGSEQAVLQVPQRDLTLQQSEAPRLEVASPVELARTPPERPGTSRARHPRRSEPASAPAAAANDASQGSARVGTASVEAAAPAAVPAVEPAAEPDDPYALPPGKTVTVIPASSGPSTDPGWTDRGPPDLPRGTTIYTGGSGGRGGRGGDCGGRQPGRGQGPDGFRGLR